MLTTVPFVAETLRSPSPVYLTMFTSSVPIPPPWTTLAPDSIRHHLEQLAVLAQQHPSGHTLNFPMLVTDELIRIYDIVSSTNTVLLDLVRHGAPDGTVVIAHQQSAGKGQWGRQWQSAEGGLYLSIALQPHCPAEWAAQLTLAVVRGVAIALRMCDIPVSIKWPNDLVVHQSTLEPHYPKTELEALYKLGGILTETRIQGHRISHAVVGIGINGANDVPPQGIALRTLWSQRPPHYETMFPVATALWPKFASLNGLAAIAIGGILSGWQSWQQEGITAVLADYNNLLSHQGQRVQIDYQGQPIDAQITGVNALGYLRLRPDPIPHSIPSAWDLSGVTASKSLLPNQTPYSGTLSFLQSSSQEILLTPSDIRLGYHLDLRYNRHDR